jgi:hypothetical protein
MAVEGMMRVSGSIWSSAALAAVVVLAGCGREADKAARTDITSGAATTSAAASADQGAPTRASYDTRRTQRRQDDGPRLQDGKPEWASNRQRSGEENAEKQFERNGKDFDAASVEAYAAKAHAFLAKPPRGVLTLTRSNGDVLYYDAKANVFVVADRQGAPRTMFRPRDGMSYWTQQKDRASQPQDRNGDDQQRSSSSRRYRARATQDDANG